jgi:alkyldihydroxyacetonephosphate synthase
MEPLELAGISDIAQSTDPLDRLMTGHDLWPRRFLEKRAGTPIPQAARVFWPKSEHEIARIVEKAADQGIPIVPYGAGSGVCGAISATDQTWVIDLKGMKRLLEVDADGRSCVVECGMVGERLERALNARGFTLGHFPSSIYCSTVGGWIAARSAGQLSSRYGKIEDMVLELWGVDGAGRSIHAALDDDETGPGALRLLIGSEGTLGIFSRARLRIHPLRSHRWLRGFVFPDLESGLSAMQQLLARGVFPSVLRLYDPGDTLLAGVDQSPTTAPDRFRAGGMSRAGLEDSGPRVEGEDSLFSVLLARLENFVLYGQGQKLQGLVSRILARPGLANGLLHRRSSACKLVVGHEGEPEQLQGQVKKTRAILEQHGARDVGDGPGEGWLKNRHRVSYKMTRMYAAGGWADTMEVAVGWKKVAPLYHAVREALKDQVVVLCHFSHAYVDGCSLYFTYAGGGTDEDGEALARYQATWSTALSVVNAHGGAVSHHHGIGRLKAAHLPLQEGHRVTLQSLKAALDPKGILNPGGLGLWGRTP